MVQEVLETNSIHWVKWSADKLVLSHSTSMLIMQGLLLSKLFDENSYFDDGQVVFSGPFILLKGELSDLWAPPLHISSLVLAQIESAPEGLSKTELLGTLLPTVLNA